MVFEAKRSSWLHEPHRALKVFDPIVSGAARSALLAEFAALTGVRHPHLLAGIDAFDLTEPPYAGCVVFVLELADEDLSHRIARAGTIPPGEVAAIGVQVADGLTALHGAGRIHGDVKPENILRVGDRWALGDFGVTGLLEGSYAVTTGATIDYRPPELATAAEGTRLHRSADVWALGVTLHVAATGRHPFRGPDPLMRYAAAVRGDRLPAPGVDPALAAIVDGACLTRDPSTRADAPTLSDLLRRWPTPPPAPPRSADAPAPDADLGAPAGSTPAAGPGPSAAATPGGMVPSWSDPVRPLVAPGAPSDPPPPPPASPPPGGPPPAPPAVVGAPPVVGPAAIPAAPPPDVAPPAGPAPAGPTATPAEPTSPFAGPSGPPVGGPFDSAAQRPEFGPTGAPAGQPGANLPSASDIAPAPGASHAPAAAPAGPGAAPASPGFVPPAGPVGQGAPVAGFAAGAAQPGVAGQVAAVGGSGVEGRGREAMVAAVVVALVVLVVTQVVAVVVGEVLDGLAARRAAYAVVSLPLAAATVVVAARRTAARPPVLAAVAAVTWAIATVALFLR
jgi:serine/threonine protein kinase